MARLPQSAVVLRFRLGKGLVKARQRYDNTARAILERVTINYADGAYDQMRKTLEQRIEQDVRAELVHQAMLFRRHIIGAAGTRVTPSGMLDTATKGEAPPRQTIGEGLPPWAPRNAEYLRQKRAATGGIGWFDNRNWRQSAYDARFASRVPRTGAGPDQAGLLFKSMRADVWETIFGPIGVRFYRMRKLTPQDSRSGISAGRQKNMKVQIGSIQVRALGKITPGMLPGYTTGTIKASDKGNPGLIGLISQYDPQLGYRLGTMRNGVYRPTLEPFLGFFLTRALPHAVSERLRKGTYGTLFK
jgi:hypothetical protein